MNFNYFILMVIVFSYLTLTKFSVYITIEQSLLAMNKLSTPPGSYWHLKHASLALSHGIKESLSLRRSLHSFFIKHEEQLPLLFGRVGKIQRHLNLQPNMVRLPCIVLENKPAIWEWWYTPCFRRVDSAEGYLVLFQGNGYNFCYYNGYL